jgi:hypothetical protein
MRATVGSECGHAFFCSLADAKVSDLYPPVWARGPDEYVLCRVRCLRAMKSLKVKGVQGLLTPGFKSR